MIFMCIQRQYLNLKWLKTDDEAQEHAYSFPLQKEMINYHFQGT